MSLWSDLKQALGRRLVMGLYGEEVSPLIDNFLRGQFPGAMGVPPYRGTREFLKAYSTMPWLRAVTSRIAQSFAAQQWQLFVPTRNPKDGQRRRMKAVQYADPQTRSARIKALVEEDALEPVLDHPFLDAMQEGNAYIDGLNVRKLTQIYLDTVGESFWIKERNSVGAPVAFWPVPPHWIINTPTPRHQFYRYSFRGWQGEIPDTEIIWITDPNPETPYYRGSGVGMSLSDELESDEYAAQLTRQFFFNNAKPDFLIYPKNNQPGDANLTSAEAKRLETDWLNKNQGFLRRWKPYFLTKEVGVHEFTQDLRQLQFVELRQFERDTIIQTFGMPPEMLGVIDKGSNRATIDKADLIFSKWVLTPRLEFLRSVLQHRLIPEYDDRLILDFVSPVQEDKQFQLSVATAFPWILDVDEARALAGRDALDNGAGEVHALPFNMTFGRMDETSLPSPAVPSLPPDGTPKLLRSLEPEDREALRAIMERAAQKRLAVSK